MNTISLILIMAICSQPSKKDTVYLCPDNPPHSCNWPFCELKGQFIFDDSVNNAYPYDSKHNKTTYDYYFDKMHFEHPTLNEEELKALVDYNLSHASI